MKNGKVSTDITIAAGQFLKEKEYWGKKFSGELVKSNFPYDYPVKSSKERLPGTLNLKLSGVLLDWLMKASNKSDPRLHMIFVAGVVILLSRYSGNKDVIIGMPIDRQEKKGAFVNTVLAVRSQIDTNFTFRELLMQVKDTINEAIENQNYPVERLLSDLNLTYADGDFPLFDVAVLIENIQDSSYIEYVNPNIIFSFLRKEDCIEYRVEYNLSLYKESTITKIMAHFTNVLNEVIANADIPLNNISVLSESERQELTVDFNTTDYEYPEDKTIIELFEEQAEKLPESIAIVFGSDRLTYKEVNAKANRLGRMIRKRSIGSNEIIGLMVEVSVEMIIAILGVLKAGAAYLPIDSEFPPERIEYILKDCNTSLLFSVSNIEKNIAFSGEIINFRVSSLPVDYGSNLKKVNHRDEIVYLMYTSGSTGNPKGVMIRHGAITNQICGLQKIYTFDNSLTHMLLAPYTFDPSVQQIFLPLTTGGKLVLVSDATKNSPAELFDYIISNHVNILNTVPSYMNVLLDFAAGELRLHFKYIILAGEVFSKDIYLKLKKFFSIDRIINIYGPTEATINTTLYECLTNETEPTISIGKPLLNYKVLILDGNKNLVPTGVSGEICISGKGIAEGYINKPGLTNKKFVANKFFPGQLLYCTGDFGKWRPDGNIEFFGRSDKQIKIRGLRIELAGVERQLLSYEGVREVVVLVNGDEQIDRYLTAYFVADNKIPGADLKEYLAGRIPDYMIPAHFIQIEKIPLTSHGKVSFKELPGFEITLDEGYTAPRDSVEKMLVAIWSQVLDVDEEKIGIDVEFFDLGGHSLKATLLISKIHKKFNVRLPIKEIFFRPTIRELGALIKESKKDWFISIEPVEKREYYELSSAQKRTYIIQQMAPGAIAYNIPIFLSLQGKLDTGRLSASLGKLISRHESLRTSLMIVNEEPVQRINDNVKFEVEYYEVGEQDSFVRCFDLCRAPLLRVGLVHLAEDNQLLLVDMHHIVSDGVSMELIIKDFVALYKGEDLPALKFQYKDFALWQNGNKKNDIVRAQEKYWLGEFKSGIPVLDMQTDYPRPGIKSFSGRRFSFDITGEDFYLVQEIVSQEKATLFMFFLAVYNIFLAKLSDQEDIIIGTPIAGRNHQDLQQVVGMFVNTIPLRNYPAADKAFKAFLAGVKERAVRAFENQDYQYEELINNLPVNQDASRNALFDVFFLVYQSVMSDLELPGLKIEQYGYENPAVKFDLSLEIIEVGDHFRCSFDYCSELFKEETLQRFAHIFKNILSDVLRDENKKICEIRVVSEDEKKKLLNNFNAVGMEFPKNKTLDHLFTEQVERVGDVTSIAFKDETISYSELNVRAGRLASILKARGVKPNGITALMVNCSIEQLIGIVAILKAGSAYLPVDPGYPAARKKIVLRDSQAQLLITRKADFNEDEDNILRCRVGENNVLFLHDEALNTGSLLDPSEALCSYNPAYLLYTSGSSGTPKGVLIRHRNVVNLVYGLRERIYKQYFTGLRIAMLSPFVFDASVKQIFAALLQGHGLYLVPEDVRINAAGLSEFYIKQKIDISDGTPFHIRMLTEIGDITTLKFRVKHFLIGGEPLIWEIVRDFLNKFEGKTPKITNVYGPTECCVDSTSFEIQSGNGHPGNQVPIGKPMPNHYISILSPDYGIKPIGVPGELCISGEGAAAGYLNRPELTSEKFITTQAASLRPQAHAEGVSPTYKLTHSSIHQPIYRSGDLARWLPDGNIEFLGRKDQQVKLRGYRIELGEIERQLSKYGEVREAVVLVHESAEGNKNLCSFIVSDKEIDVPALREYLSGLLPGYMIPNYFIRVASIPSTSRGKVDSKALISSYDLKSGQGSKYKPPRNHTEQVLCTLWQDLLGFKQVGIKDNFFDIGGDSLRAITFTVRVMKKLNVEIPLMDFFKRPTIEKLAVYIRDADKCAFSAVEPVEDKEYYELSSAQKRLYILHQMDKKNTAYNMAMVFLLAGKFDEIDEIIDKLEKALLALITRHEILRTSFDVINGSPVQRVLKNVDFAIEHYNDGSLSTAAAARQEQNRDEALIIKSTMKNFVKPFDLSMAPLLRVAVVKLEKQRCFLMLDMHHVISDGNSIEVFMTDLVMMYNGEKLPPLKVSYRDFTLWQNTLLNSKKIEEQQSYWLKQFAGSIPSLNLPADFKRTAVQSFAGSRIYFNIDSGRTKALKDLALQEGTTLFMVLLVVYNILLFKICNQQDIVIGIPSAGRRHADLESVIGMFVNTLALRNFPGRDRSFRELLWDVRDRTLTAFENQDYQFEYLVEKVARKRDASKNPLFDVMFTFQNIEKTKVELTGVELKNFNYEDKISKVDLQLICSEKDGNLDFAFEYCTARFKEESVIGFANYFNEIVNSVITEPDVKLLEIQIGSTAEREEIERQFGGDLCDD